MVFAQRRLLQAAGIRSDGRARAVLTAVGVREFAATATILGMRHRRVGAWSRVVGDTMDLALLQVAFRTRREDTPRLLGAIALVAAIFATDLFTALKLNEAEGVGIPDGSNSRGVGARTGRMAARRASGPASPSSHPRRRCVLRSTSFPGASSTPVRSRRRDRHGLYALQATAGTSFTSTTTLPRHVTCYGGLKLAGSSPDQTISYVVGRAGGDSAGAT